MDNPNVEFVGELIAVEHADSNCTLLFEPNNLGGWMLTNVHPTKAGKAIDVAALLSDFGMDEAGKWAAAALNAKLARIAQEVKEACHA